MKLIKYQYMVGNCSSIGSVTLVTSRFFFSQSCWQYTFVFVHSSLAIRPTGGDGWTSFTSGKRNCFHYSELENVRNINNLQYLQWRSKTLFPFVEICFYVTAGSGSPPPTSPHPHCHELLKANTYKLYNQLLKRAVRSQQATDFSDKKMLYFIYMLYFSYLFLNLGCILDARLCLDSSMAVPACICEWLCEENTNWSVDRDDTRGSCFFSYECFWPRRTKSVASENCNATRPFLTLW